jgi:hypothetical protein
VAAEYTNAATVMTRYFNFNNSMTNRHAGAPVGSG